MSWAGLDDDDCEFGDDERAEKDEMSVAKEMVIDGVSVSTSRLGHGGYGTVYGGSWRGTPVAVKRVHAAVSGAGGRRSFLSAFGDEWELLRRLRHPYVVQFLGVYVDSGGAPCLVMERLSTNLRRRCQAKPPLSDKTIVRLCGEVLCALAYLHAEGVMHRDLTTNNVLLTRGSDPNTKIADLGVARALFGDSPSSRVQSLSAGMTRAPGSLHYMSPESMDASGSTYNEKHDIFSYGVLVLATSVGHEPSCADDLYVPRSDDGSGPVRRLTELERRSEDLSSLPLDHPLRKIVLDCLCDDPSRRPTAADLLERLEHLPPLKEQKDGGAVKRLTSHPPLTQPLSLPTDMSSSLEERARKAEQESLRLARQLEEARRKIRDAEERACSAERAARQTLERVQHVSQAGGLATHKGVHPVHSSEEERVAGDMQESILSQTADDTQRLISMADSRARRAAERLSVAQKEFEVRMKAQEEEAGAKIRSAEKAKEDAEKAQKNALRAHKEMEERLLDMERQIQDVDARAKLSEERAREADGMARQCAALTSELERAEQRAREAEERARRVEQDLTASCSQERLVEAEQTARENARMASRLEQAEAATKHAKRQVTTLQNRAHESQERAFAAEEAVREMERLLEEAKRRSDENERHSAIVEKQLREASERVASLEQERTVLVSRADTAEREAEDNLRTAQDQYQQVMESEERAQRSEKSLYIVEIDLQEARQLNETYKQRLVEMDTVSAW